MDLDVPHAEKDAAKALGARWDRSRRCWYVPEGVDLTPFLRWIPAPRTEPPTALPGLNLRSTETYVVAAPWRCWKCGETTTVVGFLMAPGFQDFSVWEDDADGPGHWGGGDDWAYAFNLDVLPSPIAAQAMMRAPRYRRAFSRTRQGAYWANHCSTCQAPQGDFHLFEELGGPFLPRDIGDLAGQQAYRVRGVFEAGGAFGGAIDVATQIPGVGGPTANPPSSPQDQSASRSGLAVSIGQALRRWLGRD